MSKVILQKAILAKNSELADKLRRELEKKKLFVVNLMASPGAGKTTFIEAIAPFIKNENINVGVIEGDIASAIDADHLNAVGIESVQINTGGSCHLDAYMIELALKEMEITNGIIFIENVGNLICPAGFDLAEDIKILLPSVPEGDDKAFKYISIYACVDAIVLNKWDMATTFEFDLARYLLGVNAVNDTAPVFKVSAKTGEGIKEIARLLTEKYKAKFQ